MNTYTDSALSDLIKRFFQTWKKDNDYKYLDQIDTCTQNDSITLFINDLYDDSEFEDLVEILVNNPTRFLKEAARAAGELYHSRFAGSKKRIFVHVDNSPHAPTIKEVLGKKYIGKLITLSGMISGEFPKYNVPNKLTFVCPDEHPTTITQKEGSDIKTPIVCSNPNCKHRDFEINEGSADFEQYRVI